jgi:thioester reductase-like protein
MVEANSAGLVLITGITGYLGSQVTHDILHKYPQFRVRGSVRSIANKEKMAKLEKCFGKEHYDSMQFVEANLDNDEQMAAAV